MKITKKCNYCGKDVTRDPSGFKGKSHVFCSRQCMSAFSSKEKNPDHYAELKDFTGMSNHMKRLNSELNPTRMRKSTREKLRKSKLRKDSTSYAKYFSRHEHRVVAERILLRPLSPNEVIHHIDGNVRNNNPDNLALMTRSEHAKLHVLIRRNKGVMPSEYPITRLSEILY